MSINFLMSPATSIHDDLAARIKSLVAEHLGVDIHRVSENARLLKDLGADWLDRLELVIVIEDIFGVEFPDDTVNQIEVVGDLIRFIDANPRH